MRLLGSVPVLSCSNLEQSLNFYQQALQFVILNKREGEHGMEWLHLQSGDTQLMLEQKPESQTVNPTSSRLYFYTDDVMTMHHYLQAKGYEPGDVTKTKFMQEFDLFDPDGQRLTIGQRLSD